MSLLSIDDVRAMMMVPFEEREKSREPESLMRLRHAVSRAMHDHARWQCDGGNLRAQFFMTMNPYQYDNLWPRVKTELEDRGWRVQIEESCAYAHYWRVRLSA